MTATTAVFLNQQELTALLDAVEGQCTFAMASSEVAEHDALVQRLVKALDRVS